MRRSIHYFAMIVLLAMVLLTAGCAGTARGKNSSVLKYDEKLSIIDTSVSRADAMVVIRYPAIIDEDAVHAYYRSFGRHVIGGAFQASSQTRRDSENIAQSIIAKSNYYAMSLYRELQSELPDNSVLFSPHLVVLDADNQLSTTPLLATEEIPSVVTIDFNVYSHPNPKKIMDAEPLTFGDIVTPLFVVHANRWLRPSTHGLLLSSDPLLGAAWNGAEKQAEEQFNIRYSDSGLEYKRPLDFVTFLNSGSGPVPDIPLKSVGQARRDVIAV
ncbi:MAG: hypothetical protein N2C12_16510, partial [Planctomycetales bacterium]